MKSVVTGVIRPNWILAALMLAGVTAARPAAAQLRIVTYNTATGQSANPATGQTARSGMDLVLQAIGGEVVGGVSKAIDVLLLQEQFSMQVSAQSFVNLLNDLYDPVNRTMYARSNVNGLTSDPQGDAGRPGLVYNTHAVELISEIAFGAVSGTQQARQSLRYRLRPLGYDSSADFYAYNNHYKADTGTENEARRLIEAQGVRDNADALGEGAHIVYVGDYNIQSSTASMYQELLSAGPGQAHDPLNMPGSWTSNTSFKAIHTQSPASSSHFSGQTLGGMDDRFDFQLVSGEMQDGEGLGLITGSYHAFGNNGTHSCCNGAISTGMGAVPGVLMALESASDHLPVVADYQLPAKMSVQVASIPPSVAVGAPVSIDVLIANIAPALTANSADELDYTLSVTGDLLGGAMGVAQPLSGTHMHVVQLNTATPGVKTGTITVTSSSQGAGGALFQLPVNFSVGGGGGVFVPGVVAKDDFDSSLNRVSFSQDFAGGFPSNPGQPVSGFQRYQVGAGAIPYQLLDYPASPPAGDTNVGIFNPVTKTDGWFGVTDTINPDNTTANVTATWQFAVANSPDLEVSIDMAAMGDFDVTATTAPDSYNWTYSLDGGAFQPLFTSSVNEAAQATYAMAGGAMVSLDDPLFMTNTENETVQLTNALQTITSPLQGTGSVLTIRLTAKTDGQSEAYAFDNIVVSGLVFDFAPSDFNEDGFVDDADLATWSNNFGLTTGAEKSDGDSDGDGDVDGGDFLTWQQHFNAASAAGVVPEPASATLLIIAVAGLLCAGRQTGREVLSQA